MTLFSHGEVFKDVKSLYHTLLTVSQVLWFHLSFDLLMIEVEYFIVLDQFFVTVAVIRTHCFNHYPFKEHQDLVQKLVQMFTNLILKSTVVSTKALDQFRIEEALKNLA